VTRISELRTPLAITSNRHKLWRNTKFFREPHGVTTPKMAFFIVTSMKSSNLTWCFMFIYVLHVYITHNLFTSEDDVPWLCVNVCGEPRLIRPLHCDLQDLLCFPFGFICLSVRHFRNVQDSS
jgi:hypothetical protein